MSMERELDSLGLQGGELLDAGEASRAVVLFDRGYQLARQARNPASIAWFLAHRGFARVALGEHALAVPDLTQSLLLGQIGNPYVHLMRGIALFESGETLEAKSELFKAAVLVGPSVFEGQEPRYFAFAVKGMQLPPGLSDWREWTGCEPGSATHDALTDPAVYRLEVDLPN